MNKKLTYLLIGITAFVAIPIVAYAAPYLPVQGGTGTAQIPTYGQVLVGTSGGVYVPTATSSLGISGGGSSFGKSWEITTGLYGSNVLAPTTTIPIYVSSAGTSTIANLGGTYDVSAFAGADFGAKFNAAYATGPTGGFVVYVPPGTYNYSTTPAATTAGKGVMLDCAFGAKLVYTGSGDAYQANFGQSNAANSGINNCYFYGPGTTTAAVAVRLGGANGVRNFTFNNVQIENFGSTTSSGAITTGDNTYIINIANSFIHHNGKDYYDGSATNAGEQITFINTTLADCKPISDNCVHFPTASTASVNFIGGSLDDAQLRIGNIVRSVYIDGLHVENPAGDNIPKYTPIVVDNGSNSNMTISQLRWFNAANTNRPDQLISFGGSSLVINSIVGEDYGGGTKGITIVKNTGSGSVKIPSIDSQDGAFKAPLVNKTSSGIVQFFQSIAGALGIGTSTPQYEVTVSTTTASGGIEGIYYRDNSFPDGHMFMGSINVGGSYPEPGIWAGAYADAPTVTNYLLNFDNFGAGAVLNAPDANNGISFRLNNVTKMYIAPTTGNVGVGSTTPGSLLSIGGSGTGTNFFDNATTTKSGIGGIDIRGGCYAINGTCLSTGGSGTVTSIATNFSLTGGPITTTGTLAVATSSLYTGTTGQNLYFTGTNTLGATSTIFTTTASKVGIATTTPLAAFDVNAIGTGTVQSLAIRATPGGSGSFGGNLNSIVFDNLSSGNWKNQMSFRGQGNEKWAIGNDVFAQAEKNFYISDSSGNLPFYIDASGFIQTYSGGVWGWNSDATFPRNGTLDTGLSRISAGKIAVGTGGAGSIQGTLIGASIGIATTSPWAKLSVGTHNLASTSPSFVIASSSMGLATTTQFIVVNGNVGIGTSSPWKTFSVNGTGAWAGLDAATSGNVPVCINTTTNQLFQGSLTTTCTPSSERFKTDIQSSSVGLTTLMKIKPVTFYFKPNKEGTQDPQQNIGFIAEQVATVDQKLVQYQDGIIMGVRQDNLLSVIVKSIQELKEEVDALSGGTKKFATDNWQWVFIALLLLLVVGQHVRIKKLEGK